MSHNISKIATHVEKQIKRVRDIDSVADDSAPTFADYDKDTNILGDSNQNNKALGRKSQSSNSPNKWLLGPSSGKVCLSCFKTAQIRPCDTHFSAVALNDL